MNRETVVYVEGLSKSFGDVLALDALNLSVPKGVVFGMLGRNGAGKTTLLRTVMGLLRSDKGLARVFGEDLRKARIGLRSRVAYVPQEAPLFGELTLEEHAGLFRHFYPRFDGAGLEVMAKRLDVDRKRPVGGLSVGNRRKAAVALAMASGAELLVLDEPAAGLDPFARREVYDLLIDRLGGECGATVLLSTHLVGDLERLADLVAVIDHGRALRVDEVDGYTDMHAGGFARVQVLFEGDAPADFRVPGASETVLNGRVALGVTRLETSGAELAALEARPDLSVRRFPLTLEEVFIELVGPGTTKNTEEVSR